jgi:hypothetical protein
MGEKHADMWLSLHPAPKMKTSIAGLLGVLPAGPTATTIEVEDVDGRPPGRCWRQVRQRLPPKLKTSTAGPREMSELEVRECPPSILRNVGPRELSELKIRERNACGACPSDRAVNDCRSLGINAQRLIRTHFSLIQVGHFC